MVFNYRILRYPKAANLLKYTKKSTKATEILEEKKNGWNSQLTMICSVLEIPEVKVSKLGKNTFLT